jgi:hypothetical protein
MNDEAIELLTAILGELQSANQSLAQLTRGADRTEVLQSSAVEASIGSKESTHSSGGGNTGGSAKGPLQQAIETGVVSAGGLARRAIENPLTSNTEIALQSQRAAAEGIGGLAGRAIGALSKSPAAGKLASQLISGGLTRGADLNRREFVARYTGDSLRDLAANLGRFGKIDQSVFEAQARISQAQAENVFSNSVAAREAQDRINGNSTLVGAIANESAQSGGEIGKTLKDILSLIQSTVSKTSGIGSSSVRIANEENNG